jgi:hypothetical protein
MTSVTWPATYSAQRKVVAQLEARVAAAVDANRTIMLYSLTRPTVAQWETAFQQQGGTLPIPAGTRLLWNNPLSSHTIAQIIRDGEAVDAVSPYSNTGAFRLLGSGRALTSSQSVHEPSAVTAKQGWAPNNLEGTKHYSTSVDMLVPIDLIRDTQRGLISVMVIGAYIQANTRPAPSYTSLDGLFSWAEPDRNYRADIANTGISVASGAFTDGSGMALGSGIYPVLWGWLDNLLPQIVNNIQEVKYAGMSYGYLAAIFSGSGVLSLGMPAIDLRTQHNLTTLSVNGGVNLNTAGSRFTSDDLFLNSNYQMFYYGLFRNNDFAAGVRE